jgi:hypothetical protein
MVNKPDEKTHEHHGTPPNTRETLRVRSREHQRGDATIDNRKKVNGGYLLPTGLRDGPSSNRQGLFLRARSFATSGSIVGRLLSGFEFGLASAVCGCRWLIHPSKLMLLPRLFDAYRAQCAAIPIDLGLRNRFSLANPIKECSIRKPRVRYLPDALAASSGANAAERAAATSCEVLKCAFET